MYQERYWHKREFETIEKLKTIVAPTGESLTRVSLAWVLANPLITSAIIGASRAEQLSDTLAASELVLDAQIKTQLDEVSARISLGRRGAMRCFEARLPADRRQQRSPSVSKHRTRRSEHMILHGRLQRVARQSGRQCIGR